MKTSYISSAAGRLTAATAAFALISAGILAAAGPGAHEIVFVSIVPLVCIVASIFAIGMSTREHGGYAFALLLILPIAAGPYLGLLRIAPQAGLAVALALFVPGLLAATAAILGRSLFAGTGADSSGRTGTGTLQTR